MIAMEILMDIFRPETIIEYGGLALLLFIIFAETGLFFGFFLPGDSLLFVAGLLSGSPHLSLPVWLLISLVVVAAVSGTTVGYGFGYWAEGYLRNRKENFFYKKRYLEITQNFYRRYGMMVFVVGRFIPIVRTFAPILAGMVRIRFINFLVYNIAGSVIWVTSLVLLGHWLGNRYPFITDHLDFIIIGMIVLSGIPVIMTWLNHRKSIVRRGAVK
jgi:membrane-associated protein